MTAHRQFVAILLLAAAVSVATHADEAKTATVTLTATGIESRKGHVLVQLASSAEQFSSDDEGFRMARLDPSSGTLTHVFEDVPFGDYALKLFHDENDNEKVDIGWRGPTERYGFSNDARGLFGPPSWDDAKFTVDAPTVTHTINAK